MTKLKRQILWQSISEFSPWISSSRKDESYFHCKTCIDDYLGAMSAIRKHSISEKHGKNTRMISNTTRIDAIPSIANFQSLDNKRKETEINLSMFITKHNFSIQTSDHFSRLVKTLSPDTEVLKNVSCNRTKATLRPCNWKAFI